MSDARPSDIAPEHFKAYKVRRILAIPDPDMSQPRYHTVIFVETQSNDGSGHEHHVIGDLVQGMTHASNAAPKPEDSAEFHSKEFLGTVSAMFYPSAFEEVFRAQPPPPQQKAFNARTMKTEPVKTSGTFYEEGEKRMPLFKCTEWVEQRAIPALIAAGIIQQTAD